MDSREEGGFFIRRFPVDRVQPYGVRPDERLIVLDQPRHGIVVGDLICLPRPVKEQDGLCLCCVSRHGLENGDLFRKERSVTTTNKRGEMNKRKNEDVSQKKR